MSPVIVACVLAACLIAQARVGAVSEPSTENDPTHTTPTPPRDICQLPPYNTENLTRENYWFADNVHNFRGLLCFDPNATSCTFKFAFCHPIQGVNNTACQGAAVCQISNTPSETLSYSMGKFSETNQFYETNGTVAGSFYMDVVNGSRNTSDAECAKKSTGISTRIVLECNSTVQWTSQNLTDIIKVKYSEPCSFTITLPYAGACRPATPTTSIVPVSPTSTSASTSHSVKPTPPGHSNSSSSTPTSSPSGSHSSKSISPTSSSATSVSTHVHTSSSAGPKPTVSPAPSPPATTSPENTTTHHEVTTERPTTPEHPTKKTTPPPKPVVNNNNGVIHGLIAGVVIFALISVVLLVLLIFAGRVLYTKGGQYRRVSNNDDM